MTPDRERTKIVLLDAADGNVVAGDVVDQGVEQDALAGACSRGCCGKTASIRSQLGAVVATGYGRKLIRAADATITEITCQAWGVRRQMPDARTIIDIGGQDSKLLRLHADGAVDDFVMNDRCAAGTGRFLELVAASSACGWPAWENWPAAAAIGHDQQHVRRLRGDGNRRPVGLGRHAGGHRRRSVELDRGTRWGDERAERVAADRAHRRSGDGARHGDCMAAAWENRSPWSRSRNCSCAWGQPFSPAAGSTARSAGVRGVQQSGIVGRIRHTPCAARFRHTECADYHKHKP